MKKYINSKTISFVGFMLFSAMVQAQVAGANSGIGGKLELIRTGQMGSIANFIASVAFVAGIGFGLAGLFKLREYFQEPDRHTLSAPIGYLIVASLAIGLPQYLKTGQDTIGITGGTDTAKNATAQIK